MAEETVTEAYQREMALIPWWLVLLEGLTALIIGIFLFARPVGTTIFLVQVLGWYWLITGVLSLVSLFMDRTDQIWKLVGGILGIIVGILVIEQPLVSAILVPATFILVIGIMGICYGFISLFWALKTGWAAAIMGLLSIIFGLLLIGAPWVGIEMLVLVLAVLGVVGGITAIYMAFKLR
jgi:uncharacterized membrane protein HdeD (DUF308 family)